MTPTLVTPNPTRSPSWKWWITGLLLLATTINYIDRMTLTNASVRVTHELKLTETEYGNLELAFGWAFAVGSLTFGFLADRVSVYLLYPAILAAWSLVGIATGWTNGFAGLLVCRGLLGFFESGHWPCALKTTFTLLNEKDRTMGNSVLQSGASIGAVIAPQIMKLMMTEQVGSWRHAFITIGAVGMIWVVIWFAVLQPRDLVQTRPAAPTGEPLDLWGLLVSNRFWAVALLIVGVQMAWHIYRVWLMKFLQTGRGYSQTAALNFNSLFYIATDVGCILAGFVSLWLIRRRRSSPHGAQRAVYIGACMLTSLSIFIPFLGQGWLLLALLLLIAAGALALFPCYYSFVQELSPNYVGRMTGLLSMWVWAVTSPLQPLFGAIVDHTGSYDAGLVIAGLGPWIGVVAMKLLWKREAVSAPVDAVV